jgi:glycosyltransferase involved in cell wall biosynthesis
MKKLAILHPFYYSQRKGGAELQISYLSDYCRKHGMNVYFIFENQNETLEITDQTIYPLFKYKNFRFLGKVWFLYRKKIISILKEIKPDIIYTRYACSWVGFASEYAKIHKIRHVHALSSDNTFAFENRLISILQPFDLIDNHYQRKGLKESTSIIFQNSFQQKYFISRFGRKGVIINQMAPLVPQNLIQKKTDIISIVWIGNLKPVKRPELFIEICKKVGNLNIPVKMIMAGRSMPKYSDLIKKAINEMPYLEYMGDLSQDDVLLLLLRSHILINTSVCEGFSNTFVQAWMRKVPVISMNSDPNELITNECLGILAHTIDEVVSAIKKLVLEPGIRQKMADLCYNYAVNNCDIDVNMNLVIDILNGKNS